MAKTKATHRGECQLCGHVQKLPGGALSLHGYTKQWGFFQGSCPGSRKLPYEISCDQIEKRIPQVRSSIDDLHEHAANVRADRATVRFNKRIQRGYGKYVEQSFEVLASEIVQNDHTFEIPVEITEYAKTEKRVLNFTHYDCEGVDAFVAKLNGLAADAIERHVAQLVSYLDWLVARKRGWSKRELRPVEVEVAKPKTTCDAQDYSFRGKYGACRAKRVAGTNYCYRHQGR